MLIHSLTIIDDFVETLNASLQQVKPGAQLSRCQRAGIAILLVGIIVTQTLNWAAFERRSLKQAKASRLRWIFYKAEITWDWLLLASVKAVLNHYGITEGVVVYDDTSKKRAKKTSTIADAHKIKDKASGGYINGQELLFMLFVSESVTFPIGFKFYMPDPVLSAWRKQDKALKKQKIPKGERPVRPKPNHDDYPTLQQLGVHLMKRFTDVFPEVKIKAVLADALYSTDDFIEKVSALTGGAQVVSQLRSSQVVLSKNSRATLKQYFARQSGVNTSLVIRGEHNKPVTVLAARLRVKAHGYKYRYVVALKYEGESDYRYLVASNVSWRYEDILKVYTLRWLVEVFIQDWKAHGGWNKLAKQQGEKGSARGVILSLLCDHALLLHPQQSALIKNKQPGMTAGCLTESLRSHALFETLKSVVQAENPLESLEAIRLALEDCLPARVSAKHMIGRDLGLQEPTPSLQYHVQNMR